MKKFLPMLLLVLFMIYGASFSQSAKVSDFLSQGLQAYKNSQWEDAITLLKKANSMNETKGPEALYLLIMAQMFYGDYSAVLENCEYFISIYPKSEYRGYVEYQKGRALHYLGKYVDSISVFQKFCTENESNEMFSSALFWMAENLYVTYHFEEAKGIFERIVSDYPNSAKYVEALYRLDLITAREKEEKLLYLLKVTGEEFLSSKEDFERQLRQYNTAENIDLHAQLEDTEFELKKLQEDYDELKSRYKKLEESFDALLADSAAKGVQQSLDYKKDLEELRRKAEQVRSVVNEGQRGRVTNTKSTNSEILQPAEKESSYDGSSLKIEQP
ncbi:MAG: outer membrane protein assembly factor BamD [Treponemataceae bacterium]